MPTAFQRAPRAMALRAAWRGGGSAVVARRGATARAVAWPRVLSRELTTSKRAIRAAVAKNHPELTPPPPPDDALSAAVLHTADAPAYTCNKRFRFRGLTALGLGQLLFWFTYAVHERQMSAEILPELQVSPWWTRLGQVGSLAYLGLVRYWGRRSIAYVGVTRLVAGATAQPAVKIGHHTLLGRVKHRTLSPQDVYVPTNVAGQRPGTDYFYFRVAGQRTYSLLDQRKGTVVNEPLLASILNVDRIALRGFQRAPAK